MNLDTSDLYEASDIIRYELVTLRVPVHEGEDPPSTWRWDHLIDDPDATLIRAVPEDHTILEVRFTVGDIDSMASGEWMGLDDFDAIPLEAALELSREAAPFIEDTVRNLAAELLFEAVTETL